MCIICIIMSIAEAFWTVNTIPCSCIHRGLGLSLTCTVQCCKILATCTRTCYVYIKPPSALLCTRCWYVAPFQLFPFNPPPPPKSQDWFSANKPWTKTSPHSLTRAPLLCTPHYSDVAVFLVNSTAYVELCQLSSIYTQLVYMFRSSSLCALCVCCEWMSVCVCVCVIMCSVFPGAYIMHNACMIWPIIAQLSVNGVSMPIYRNSTSLFGEAKYKGCSEVTHGLRQPSQ